jgi:hypothetical protein
LFFKRSPLQGEIYFTVNTKEMYLKEAKGTWGDQKKRLREKFRSLTDNDLFLKAGEKGLMLDKLQLKLGKTKEELNWLLLTV